jgi:hypothetical protein
MQVRIAKVTTVSPSGISRYQGRPDEESEPQTKSRGRKWEREEIGGLGNAVARLFNTAFTE